MAQSATELARSAMSAYQALESFEATQRISAGSISAEAHVRFKKPGQITVEYRTYQDPLSELEEKLTGGAEFAPDDLIGMQVVYDGRGTWLYDSGDDVAVYKEGKSLQEPLPGTEAVAEVGFLRGLTRDFLLRDEGEETVAGRRAHCLGLKPKRYHRSLLLKEEGFPLEKATLALDAETFFPLRITYTPSRGSALSYLVGQSTSITIEYSGVRLGEINRGRFSFSPPQGTRVFREEMVSADALAEEIPFGLHLDVLQGDGKYVVYGNRAVVTATEEKDRAHALLTLLPGRKGGDEESPSHMLSLRVGNYLSPNMSRRRALLAENGEEVPLDDLAGRFLDRVGLLGDQFPEATARRIMEIGWEQEGLFWFLLGEELEKEALIGLARVFAQGHRASE